MVNRLVSARPVPHPPLADRHLTSAITSAAGSTVTLLGRLARPAERDHCAGLWLPDQLFSLARLSIVSMADCQSSSEADPSVSSSLTRFFKALDAWAKRELSGMGELIELRKSRSFAAASGAGSSRAPCNVSSAAAASLLSALIWSLASRSLLPGFFSSG